MRTLAITQNITLDGRIEMLGDWFDPAGGDDDPEQLAALREQRERADALLLGRRTFEDFRGFWPHQHDDTTGTSAYLDQVSKYVVSPAVTDPGWQHSTALRGVDDVRALRAGAGGDIVCTGSITLTHALFEAGLVDEVRLMLYPAVQGRGRGLFPDGYEPARCDLVETRRFGNGVVLLVYRFE